MKMRFSYTYRDRTGSLKNDCVEAESRTDAYAKLKAKGIIPTSMKVMNAKAGDYRGEASNKRHTGIIVGLVVIVVSLCAGLFLANNKEAPVNASISDKPKKTKKQELPVYVPEVTPSETKTNTPLPIVQEKPKKLTAEERIALIEKKILEKPMDFSTPTNNRAFRTGFEQKLAAIFATPLGAPPPMIPLRMTPVTYLRLQEILDAPNTVFDTDSEKVAEAKMAVEMAKKELKEYISQGGDPEKFLEHYYSQLKQASEEWKAAQMELVRTMKTDPGLAVTMEAEFNEHFSQKGIRPVKMPAKLKERYGIK